MENKMNLTGKPSIDKPWLKWYSYEAINAQVPMMRNYDYMLYRNLDNLDSVAIQYFGNKITYNQLLENIEKAMASFQAMGVKKGDIVTFCMPTLPETIYAFYALNRLGAVGAMIDPTTNNERIEQFIKMFDSKYLVMVDLAYPKLKETLKNTKIEKVITVSATDSLSPIMKLGYKAKNTIAEIKHEKSKLEIPFNDQYISWKQFTEIGKGVTTKDVSYEENLPVGIVLTSGTTGIPKGAVLSNDNLNAIAVQQGYCTNMEKKDTFLNIMPPFIAYGLVCGISNVLCNGLEMIIVPKFEKRSIKDRIKEGDAKLDKSSMFDTLLLKHHPQHVLGVPNFYLKLEESKKMEGKSLSFLKCCISGGDTFHSSKEKLVNSFLEAHKCEREIDKGYGMTELCSVASYTNCPEVNKLGSVGIPVMMNNAKIVDLETGEELGYNQVGELYMSGPGAIIGYFGNPNETAKTFVTDKEGTRWVKTGDLFTMDEDGVLFFKGRIKRMMVRPDGHNVFNEPIEEVILSHYAVKDCAVIGVKSDVENGEIPTAIIVLKEEFYGQEKRIYEELQALSLAKLPERDIALEYAFQDELPYTTVSKVDYRKLENENKRLVKSL